MTGSKLSHAIVIPLLRNQNRWLLSELVHVLRMSVFTAPRPQGTSKYLSRKRNPMGPR